MSPRRRRGRLSHGPPASQRDLADLRGCVEAHRFAIAIIGGVLAQREPAFAANFDAALRELRARLIAEGLNLAAPAIRAALEEMESLAIETPSPQPDGAAGAADGKEPS